MPVDISYLKTTDLRTRETFVFTLAPEPYRFPEITGLNVPFHLFATKPPGKLDNFLLKTKMTVTVNNYISKYLGLKYKFKVVFACHILSFASFINMNAPEKGHRPQKNVDQK